MEDAPVHSLKAHEDGISSIEIFKEDVQIVTGGHDSWVKVWDTRKMNTVFTYEQKEKKYDEGVLCLGVNSRIEGFFSGGVDGALRSFQ